MEKRIEVLAPAGSYESFIAAVNAGADAVYLGGNMYGARAYADNFNEEALINAIEYAHIYDVKVYLTINTLFREEEIDNLYDYIKPLYEAGLDAVIVQDLGVLKYIRSNFPLIDVHASTQMSTTGKYGASILKDMGVRRIVTAREISLEEIKDISNNVDVEIESFVHGAMCYSYSGQCLLSSFIGGRSGNRGRCAQACRLPYEVENSKLYYMSLKDMCTLYILPDIIDAGVFSLKIEGRMKSPQYTAYVTHIYKKYADMYLRNGREGYKVEESDVNNLMELYNRGNFCDGYYRCRNSRDMFAFERPNHQGVLIGKVIKRTGNEALVKLLKEVNPKDVLDVYDKYDYTLKEHKKPGDTILLKLSKESRLKVSDKVYRMRNDKLLEWISNKFVNSNRKLMLTGYFVANISQKAYFTVCYEDDSISVETDEVVMPAESRPVTVEDVKKQLNKTGNSNYGFSQLEVYIDDGAFISMKALNECRRKALEEFGRLRIEKYKRNLECRISDKYSGNNYNGPISVNILLEKMQCPQEVLENDKVKRIYIESFAINSADEYHSFYEYVKKYDKELYIAMPYVFRDKSKALFLSNLRDLNTDGYLVRNLEEYGFLKEHCVDFGVVFDYNVYQYNSFAKDVLVNDMQGEVTCSVELNSKQLEESLASGNELIVYGYLPMMISAQCFNKCTLGCDAVMKITSVKDRCKNTFCVRNVCKDCYNIIYNSSPLLIYDKDMAIDRLKVKSIRINIAEFEAEDIATIVANVISGNNVYRNYTRGHFSRGVL